MGFLRRLFGGGTKKSECCESDPNRRLWSFVRSLKGKKRLALPSSQHYGGGTISYGDNFDPDRHAIAMAVATAAVAEAALAAAQAAAEVVRLTGGGVVNLRNHPPAKVNRTQRLATAEQAAAIQIQCGFRGYLARRALRALKALVKLQALARGYIVRKRMSDMMRRMQTLVRVQARARIGRATGSSNPSSISLSPLLRCNSISKLRDNTETDNAPFGSTWFDHWMEESVGRHTLLRNANDDERSTKILEVDTWKPSKITNRDPSLDYINPLGVPIDTSFRHHSRGKAEPFRYVPDVLSRPLSSSSRRDNLSPMKSELSWGSHPSYMSNTESSRAKFRSHSAPRQRMELDHYRHNRLSRTEMGSWDGWPASAHQHGDSRTRQFPERQQRPYIR